MPSGYSKMAAVVYLTLGALFGAHPGGDRRVET
jgi:hypothetical protein